MLMVLKEDWTLIEFASNALRRTLLIVNEAVATACIANTSIANVLIVNVREIVEPQKVMYAKIHPVSIQKWLEQPLENVLEPTIVMKKEILNQMVFVVVLIKNLVVQHVISVVPDIIKMEKNAKNVGKEHTRI